MGYFYKALSNHNYYLWKNDCFVFRHVFEMGIGRIGAKVWWVFFTERLCEFYKWGFFFSFAQYATDVTFQQCVRPAGVAQEGKLYSSRKQKLYGLKVEVSVISNDITAFCTKLFLGPKQLIQFCRKTLPCKKKLSEKSNHDMSIEDRRTLATTLSNYWAILCDKSYSMTPELLRAVRPHRKLLHRTLTPKPKDQFMIELW